MSIQPASPSGGVSQAKVRLALACHPQVCRRLSGLVGPAEVGERARRRSGRGRFRCGNSLHAPGAARWGAHRQGAARAWMLEAGGRWLDHVVDLTPGAVDAQCRTSQEVAGKVTWSQRREGSARRRDSPHPAHRCVRRRSYHPGDTGSIEAPVRTPINAPSRLTAVPPLDPPDATASVMIQARSICPSVLKALTTPSV